MSYQLTPLFSVEGQKVQALQELKKHPEKMAVVFELEQDRTGRVQYTYELLPVREIKAGQDWPAPAGWKGTVRAVVFPWEVQIKNVQIINIYHEYYP